MKPIRLFEAFGIEIEHMIVDRETLLVRPYADRVLVHDGEIVAELEDGDIAWSNELAMHVVELKTNGPAPALDPLPTRFRESARRLDEKLAPLGCMLLPGAMHPLMEPDREFVRWPHDDHEIYTAFDRIFDCRGHGWSNLQSVHLNLPFEGDEEFGRLHTAVRLLLPILPALSAASPYYGGRQQRFRDARLEVYRHNAKRVPEVTGAVIPELVDSRVEYEDGILRPLYSALRPLDHAGILRHEWSNARGAIARFDRNTIEIRVIDAQESSEADVAICAIATEILRRLVREDEARQRRLSTEQLSLILTDTIEAAEDAVIRDAAYLEAFAFPDRPARAGDLWAHLTESTDIRGHALWGPALAIILEHGTLASRLVEACGGEPAPERLIEVYRTMSSCLLEGRSFLP